MKMIFPVSMEHAQNKDDLSGVDGTRQVNLDVKTSVAPINCEASPPPGPNQEGLITVITTARWKE